MVQFINDLIAVANPFIGQVFSYPFAFIPLKEGEPLDYKFRMQVGDVVVPDIARCSEGQKDFADLAFRLARIILSKQTDYPIYLDECDKAFDFYHKQQLLELLKTLTQEPRVVSQLFMINHNISMYSGMREAEILVLNENNIVLPPAYNEHARFTRY
jgi:ABC-type enterochelin transport system ATPase subunit